MVVDWALTDYHTGLCWLPSSFPEFSETERSLCRLRDPQWFSKSSLHQSELAFLVRVRYHTAAVHRLRGQTLEASGAAAGCARRGLPAPLVVSWSQHTIKTWMHLSDVLMEK